MAAKNTPLTLAQLIGGMATFGSATPVSKIVTQAMPIFVGSFLRVGIGALALAPLAWSKLGTIREMTRSDWLRIVIIALFGMFGFSALMLYGMSMVSGVAGAIVMSTAPAVTAAASMLFLGDHPTWRKLTAIVLAVGGVLVFGTLGFFFLDEQHFAADFTLRQSFRQAVTTFFLSDIGLPPATPFGREFLIGMNMLGGATMAYVVYLLLRPLILRPPSAERQTPWWFCW